jgi:hypothetical protein
MRKRWLLILGAPLVLVLGVGALLVSRGTDEPADSSNGALGKQMWHELARKNQQESRHSSATAWPFAGIKALPQRMPPALREKSREVFPDSGSLRLRFASARYVDVSRRQGLWVVPGRGVLCILSAKSMAASCATRHAAYRSGVVLQLYELNDSKTRPTAFVTLGIAPNGIGSVKAKIGKTRWTRFPVAGNTFFAKTQQPVFVPSQRSAE